MPLTPEELTEHHERITVLRREVREAQIRVDTIKEELKDAKERLADASLDLNAYLDGLAKPMPLFEGEE